MMSGVLEGIKVIDMGHAVAIPSAGAMLADWGAEVIKVEPLLGDRARLGRKIFGVNRTVKIDGGETNWVIQVHNRNKRGLAVDLKKEPGRDVLYKLVQKADVFMSNYEVSALKSLKIDYTTLSQLNPKLVYAVLTGYGTKGPDKAERGFDFTAAWARSGMQYLIGNPDCPPPNQRGGMNDRVAGAHVVAGIASALLHRERTGEGQELEFSLYHSAVWTIVADIQGALLGLPLPRHERTKASSPVGNTYRTKDDRWFHLIVAEAEWPSFCRAAEKPELENDPRFNTPEVREENCEELIRILDETFAAKTMSEWESRFRESNVIYGRVQTAVEVANDPQAIANDFFTEVQFPTGGRMKLVATPVTFHQNPASVRPPAPEIGEHTEEILLGLGYSQEDIARLREQGVVR